MSVPTGDRRRHASRRPRHRMRRARLLVPSDHLQSTGPLAVSVELGRRHQRRRAARLRTATDGAGSIWSVSRCGSRRCGWTARAGSPRAAPTGSSRQSWCASRPRALTSLGRCPSGCGPPMIVASSRSSSRWMVDCWRRGPRAAARSASSGTRAACATAARTCCGPSPATAAATPARRPTARSRSSSTTAEADGGR